jgi:hypothetical protein
VWPIHAPLPADPCRSDIPPNLSTP